MVKIENLNLEVYGIIYLIRNKVSGKYYVGQTQKEKGFNGRYKPSGEGIERVYKHHKSRKEHNRDYNSHLLNSIEKYGFEAFEVKECIDVAFSREELNIKEKAYIKLYDSFKNGYNDTEGGDGVEGYSHTEETRKRISEALRGKHHTDETRQKLSEVRKGKHHTEESKQRMSEANKGKHHTEESRQKLSEAKKGRNNPRAKAVYCHEFDEIRLTAKEWAEELNLFRQNIGKCCKGELKSTHGYRFRYATEEEIQIYRQKLYNDLSEGSISKILPFIMQ